MNIAMHTQAATSFGPEPMSAVATAHLMLVLLLSIVSATVGWSLTSQGQHAHDAAWAHPESLPVAYLIDQRP